MVRQAHNTNNSNNNNKHSVYQATCPKILQTVWRWQEANRRRQEHMKHIWLWHYVNPQNFTIHSKRLITLKKKNLPRSMLSSRLNLPVFRQIQDIKRCLTLADILNTSVSIRWVFCNACHVLRQKFGYFIFEKHVKFAAIFSSFTKTTERTQPRPQCFSATVPFLARPLL